MAARALRAPTPELGGVVTRFQLTQHDRNVLNFGLVLAKTQTYCDGHGYVYAELTRLQEELLGVPPGSLNGSGCGAGRHPETELFSILVGGRDSQIEDLQVVLATHAQAADLGMAPRLRCLFTFVPA